MNVYIDTSVVLRRLLGEPGQWNSRKIKKAYTCELLPIEIGRTVDRLRLARQIDDAGVVSLLEAARKVVRSMEVVYFDDTIRTTAAGPMPTVVGSLDGLHLATALAIRDFLEPDLIFATHDQQLSNAARARGFQLVGLAAE